MMEKLKLVKKKIYSYDCPNILNLTEFIYEGTEKANIKIILKNNGEIKWPKDKTKLIFDETSQIKGDDIILFPQEIGEENSYTAILTNLEDLKDGEYKAYLAFNVGGKNYGEKLTLMVKIKKKENKNEQIDKYNKAPSPSIDRYSPINLNTHSDNKFIGIPCKNWFQISESILSFIKILFES